MRANTLFLLLFFGCSAAGSMHADTGSHRDSELDATPVTDSAAEGQLIDASLDVDAGGNRDASIPAHAVPADATEAGASDAGTCQYPVVWTPEPARQTAVRAALQTASPSATMTWNATLGTPSTMQRIGLSFSCSDDEDYWLPLRALLLTHQNVFQINPDEWAHTMVPCRTFTVTARNLTFARSTIGAQPISRDVVNFYFRRVGANTIEVASMVGTYVPHDTDVAERLARCGRISDGDVAANVRAAAYEYLIYRGAIACQASGRGSYTPNATDEVSILPASHASWFTRADGVVFSRYLEAELRVDGNNVTDDIRASNARCPDGTGWVVRFDEVTGASLSVRAGIGCVVC